jgi:pyridoxal phosphate enzyme (YggS family)
MPIDSEHLRKNVENAMVRIEAARARGGRGQHVRLLAATKYLSVGDMSALADAGLHLVGENRAEELESKWSVWAEQFEFHFIGHLQRRKVRDVVGRVTMVHSVDSLRLAQEIDRRAPAPIDALVEVNVSGEESKYGILPGDAEAFLEQAQAFEAVQFRGFMTMAPLVRDPEEARPVFRQMRELRDRLAPLFTPRYSLDELSMGMSSDYEVAVEEGATIVRLGGTLFAGTQGG